MGTRQTYQHPLRLGGAGKRDTRTQFGALCYRVRKSEVQVLLISSLTTRRWILPKGWPMDGLTPADAAAQEAWEEAGVKGNVFDMCLGIYSYNKMIEPMVVLPCLVVVFPLEVKKFEDIYPEAGLRRRKWFSLKKAATRLAEPELQQILRDFDPKRLR
jgi:8-oxo-dGTP pyrophosphatase MutT (NUDIX family)